ncbi:hypothetical protein [Microtetraspora sp. NBRC 16547]|uniref:hypothetical protein n=1 Tax=Microtetraspora sp. NBRC 16547 TaxID=3030993 RepID=UPI0024A01414|nr:hypothetical protein [Microtetraspora sp. NBRC 16547]GLW99246.1 hypothetical protein Misp02_33330 [Microtetraspora sp. NBRC 16547]
MNRRSLIGILGWLIAAAVATVTSTWAISLLGEGLTQKVVSPMSQADVDRALAAATAPGRTVTPTPSPTGRITAPTPSPTGRIMSPSPSVTVTGGASRAFTVPGGSFVASCDGGLASLLSWSPAQGYAADDVDRGPDREVKVEFESEADKVTVKITCSGGVPVPSAKVHDD